MAKWMSFVEVDSGVRKTKIWNVVSKVSDSGGTILGQVRWFSRWRAYSFFPRAFTVFEKDCLYDLADFVENKTKEHKEKK